MREQTSWLVLEPFSRIPLCFGWGGQKRDMLEGAAAARAVRGACGSPRAHWSAGATAPLSLRQPPPPWSVEETERLHTCLKTRQAPGVCPWLSALPVGSLQLGAPGWEPLLMKGALCPRGETTLTTEAHQGRAHRCVKERKPGSPKLCSQQAWPLSVPTPAWGPVVTSSQAWGGRSCPAEPWHPACSLPRERLQHPQRESSSCPASRERGRGTRACSRLTAPQGTWACGPAPATPLGRPRARMLRSGVPTAPGHTPPPTQKPRKTGLRHCSPSSRVQETPWLRGPCSCCRAQLGCIPAGLTY